MLHPARRRSRRARDAVRAAVRDPLILETTPDSPGADQARQALAAGADRVLAAGGDGTVREVAGVLAGTGVPLGIVPVGTANLFALNLGLRGSLESLVHAAVSGPVRYVDVGRAGWVARDSAPEQSIFLVMAGIGRDAETVAATRHDLKHRLGHLGWLAYLESGARHIARPPISLTVSVDERPPEELRVWTLLAGNAGRIPAGIEVFPGTVLDDGVLETLAMSARGPLDWVRAAQRGLGHSRRPAPGLRYGTARRLVVTPDRPRPVQLDGDVIDDVVRLTLTVARRALGVVAPG